MFANLLARLGLVGGSGGTESGNLMAEDGNNLTTEAGDILRLE